MKKFDIQQLKNKAEAELQKDLKENREKLRGLKFDLAQGKVKNIREIRDIKKVIARVMTILNS